MIFLDTYQEDVKKEFGGWFDLEGATAIPVHGVADAVWLGMENQHRVLQYSLSQKRITRVLNLPGEYFLCNSYK